jgi:hypothetical protein
MSPAPRVPLARSDARRIGELIVIYVHIGSLCIYWKATESPLGFAMLWSATSQSLELRLPYDSD